jgi:glycosyltransferase involved in cell wall biosynthesis
LPDGRCVRHFGFIPKKQLARLYREAFCLLYPSLFEGFGLPVLEAMMSGCPVVTHRDSAMEEVLGKAGWYFDPARGVDSLSEILREMSLSVTERNKRVESGRARARDFNEDSLYEGMRSAYLSASSRS